MSAIIASASDMQRFDTNVARTDKCWNWTACTRTGYGLIRINGRQEDAHRVAYVNARGQIPDGMLVDHICFNRRCVNPDHLRLVTPKQNIEHRQGANASSASRLRGVYKRPDRRSKPYYAYVRHNGKQHSAGYHTTADEAALAAALLRSRMFTHADEFVSLPTEPKS
ncbi:HNH endonuclease [Curtobacterium sp. MCSS17_006]|uniref:HNH endonuclease signature motif containing protein n=1 Tax=Curtobacterium sp. MCSS17_006 TaxID=2175642 RepID=UPI000DA965E0|nr:HNH endonuclease signature motif containing protein [Curtobacterium sp. MCSS17_006]PZE33982.1 HNH endonuclease [Curtobacterium sp. MCSS17_006]